MLESVYQIVSYSFVGINKYDVGTGVMQQLSNEEADAVLRPLFDAKRKEQAMMLQLEKLPLNLKRNSPMYNTKPSPSQPSQVISDPLPIRVNNADFRRRSAAGEIVLSPFKQWQAVLTYTNGQSVNKAVRGYETYYSLSSWYPFVGSSKNGDFVVIDGVAYQARVDTVWSRIYYNDEFTPAQLGWVDPSADEINQFINGLVVDHELVTSTLADHNDRTVDLLTSMAEMPETVAMVVNACKTCLRMYVDARRKAFRLQNNVARWKNAKTSDRTRRQAIRNTTELNAAIADVWLTYRYGIMPNVYLIEDALEALNAPETLFLRDRGRRKSDHTFIFRQNWQSDPVEVVSRAMVKSRLDGGSTKVDSQLSYSLTKTAWELIPLSFVIDWFVNIGDLLSATWPTASAAQGSTFSWQAHFTVPYVEPVTGARVTVLFKGYKRIVIDPLQFCKLQWDPYVDSVRKMDALSLAWKIFLERHFKQLS